MSNSYCRWAIKEAQGCKATLFVNYIKAKKMYVQIFFLYHLLEYFLCSMSRDKVASKP